MRIKQFVLTTAIGIFMVFSLSLVTPQTYAYWASGVTITNDNSTANITVGTWDQIFPWDTNATYVVGDLVTNNGTTYRAKKDNPTKEPGVDGGWSSQWTAV
jgi:hypothetical protein